MDIDLGNHLCRRVSHKVNCSSKISTSITAELF